MQIMTELLRRREAVLGHAVAAGWTLVATIHSRSC